MAYADGFLADYSDIVNADTTPNYWSTVMDVPYLAAGAVDDSGRNMRLGCMVSGSQTSNTCMWGLMIRSDYLKAAGLEVPTTIDDWTEMLRAFKANGVKYPLALNKSGYWKSRNAFSCAWNIDARNFYIRQDTHEVAYGPASPEYKDYMATLNMWYSEGLINPDFMTDTSNESWSMIANGDAGAICNHTVGYTANYYNVVEKENPDAALVAAQMPKLNDSDDLTHVMYTSYRLDIGNAKYIVSTTEHLNECVAFLDALHNPTINYLNTYGIKDVAYTINEVRLSAVQRHEAKPPPRISSARAVHLANWTVTSDSDVNYIKTSKYGYGVQPQTIDLYTQCGVMMESSRISPATFTDEEAEIIG